MQFWNTALGFFWRDESLPVLVMVLSLAVLLLHFLREGRRSVGNTLRFFCVCFVGKFISGLFFAMQSARAAEILHELFEIGAGIAVIRLCGLLLFRIVLPWAKLTLPRITEDIIVIIAYLVWGMVRLRYAGLDLGSIVATSAMVTAVVAFAMQDTLGNILGGLALQLDNSIEIGNWIKVDDISGRVVDIRWRSTLVETRNWETVVFPNSQLMKSKFLVLGRRTDMPVQWRRWVWFNVDMGTPPTKVIAVVEEAILQTEIAGVANTPSPNCVLMDMDSKGYARYALRYWLTDLAADDATDGIIRWHVVTALQRAGIRLALEESGVHITKEGEKHEEVVHHREIALRIKTLKRVELFSQMTDEELRELAERLRFSPFARGNMISRQGAASHWLYIIISGEAEVHLEMPDGGKRHLRTLGKGSFFGEMGLMMGATRSATVVAKTDVECYRLDKEMFEEILRARPVIADEMAHVLATRKAEQQALLQAVDAQGAQAHAVQQSGEILSTIKRFFGLSA